VRINGPIAYIVLYVALYVAFGVASPTTAIEQFHSCGVNGGSAVCLLRRFEMYTRVLGLTISALILTYGAVGAIAQEKTQQPDQNKRNPNVWARKTRARWGKAV
jgi:hypothetical protein